MRRLHRLPADDLTAADQLAQQRALPDPVRALVLGGLLLQRRELVTRADESGVSTWTSIRGGA